ncbi:MAG: DUF4856 domain-containing protein [Oligoflexus sp.]|nr:DUF4856 domain-containing protein [Pseudopedobacter sp.]
MKSLSILSLLTIATAFVSCQKNEEATLQLRTKIEASKITASTPYASTFLDASNNSTVDFSAGNAKLEMFRGLDTYINLNKTQAISADISKNIYANIGNPFTAAYTSNFSTLNAIGFNLKSFTAASFSTSEANTVRQKIETDLTANAALVNSLSVIASNGVAGKLGTYMVDSKGIEVAQVIQKGLIGAFQIDYINNVLLSAGLNADNSKLVDGKNYTQLEQNWDQAYGVLTTNSIYLAGSTDAVRGTTEFGLGSYVWEFNKTNYSNIYLAFLKGRAAIVNNDRAELEKQALFIRTQFEIAIANSALGYLTKWGTSTTDAARAHAISEGLGFIYSLRFCKTYTADSKFSDDILTALIGSTNGFWDLTSSKTSTASVAIKTKFNIN